MRKTTFTKVLSLLLTMIMVLSAFTSCALRDAKDGVDGKDGADGINGLSAYELAVQFGYDGTVEEWLDSLNGKSAYEIAKDSGYTGSEEDWLKSLAAQNGKDGVGIKTAAFNEKGELVITLTDDSRINLGTASLNNGADGKDGSNGKDGVAC